MKTNTPTPWSKSQVEFDAEIWASLRPENGLFECVGKGQDITAITFDFNGLKEGSNSTFIANAVNSHKDLITIAKCYLAICKKDQSEFVKQTIAEAEGK